jgi:hypothetical protein
MLGAPRKTPFKGTIVDHCHKSQLATVINHSGDGIVRFVQRGEL